MERPHPGSYWVRLWQGITIYGYAMTEQEFLEDERSLGADSEELAFEGRMFRRKLSLGLVYGKAYSIACPEGEYGTTPVRQAMKITKEEFEQAQRAEWTI